MRPWMRIAITSACLVTGLLLMNARSQGHATPLRRALDDFPTRIAAWQGQEAVASGGWRVASGERRPIARMCLRFVKPTRSSRAVRPWLPRVAGWKA